MVALYGLQGGSIFKDPIPEGVYEEQQEITNSVKNLVRDAADDTLKIMMTHGAFHPEETTNYDSVEKADFLLTEVPYWQMCQDTKYPKIEDVKNWMESAIEKIVRDGMDDIEDRYGNRVEFDTELIRAEVTIKGINRFEPDNIEIELIMPTTVNSGDVIYFTAVSEAYKEITGIEEVPVHRTPEGAFFQFGYFQFGVPSFSTLGWALPEAEAEEGDRPARAGGGGGAG